MALDEQVFTDSAKPILKTVRLDWPMARSVPCTRKYQKDDGLGVIANLERLKESDRPNEDRRAFFETQIVLWLLGATGGHAKNFSIAYQPGGGLHLTPLCDVLAAQPVVDAGRIGQNRLTLAMSLGDNNYRRMDVVCRRHLDQTAKAAGLPKDSVDTICHKLKDLVPSALEAICGQVGNEVPVALRTSVVNGIQARFEALSME